MRIASRHANHTNHGLTTVESCSIQSRHGCEFPAQCFTRVPAVPDRIQLHSSPMHPGKCTCNDYAYSTAVTSSVACPAPEKVLSCRPALQSCKKPVQSRKRFRIQSQHQQQQAVAPEAVSGGTDTYKSESHDEIKSSHDQPPKAKQATVLETWLQVCSAALHLHHFCCISSSVMQMTCLFILHA